MRPEYRDEPCRSALTRVRNMPFKWSLNPYMGCAHRCTFCFVRAFERLADRPSDARYGTSIRVKTNLVEVLSGELARRSWRREQVVIGTATDPYQPAEGHFRLTRRAIEALGAARTPLSLITRGPLIVRDVDVLRWRRRAGGRRRDLLDPDARPGDLAAHRTGHRPARRSVSGRFARSSTPASTRASAWPRSCPACRTIRPGWPTSCAPRGTPARHRSGPTCCTSDPARGSTSSTALARDWPAAPATVRAALRGPVVRDERCPRARPDQGSHIGEPVRHRGPPAPPDPATRPNRNSSRLAGVRASPDAALPSRLATAAGRSSA